MASWTVLMVKMKKIVHGLLVSNQYLIHITADITVKNHTAFVQSCFFQAHTIGCFQYKPLITAQNRKTGHRQMNTELIFTCPNETLTLDNKFVNDLIPDCNSNADENILYLMLTTNYKHNMTNISKKYNPNVHKHCFEGHPKIYHVNNECIYEVDKNGIFKNLQKWKTPSKLF